MKKKISLFVFILFIILIFTSKVSALSEYTCTYESGSETYDLKFRVRGNQVEMLSCNRSYPEPCDDYVFDTNGYYLRKETTCPSSFDVYPQKKLIIWVADEKGMFKISKKSDITNLGVSACYDNKTKTGCNNAIGVACLWIDDDRAAGTKGGYCNVDNLQYVYCGDGARDLPTFLPYLISMLVNLLKIATPIILIIVSILSLVKALAASKEDEIKKAQSALIRKMIAAAMVFFVISIVQFVILKVSNTDDEADGFSSCLSCFLNNDCAKNTYYKTTVSGVTYCTKLITGKSEICPEDK